MHRHGRLFREVRSFFYYGKKSRFLAMAVDWRAMKLNLTQQDRKWAEQTVEKIKSKMYAVTERCADKVPYTTKDGVFDDRSGSEDISWWTNGFWGGMMWQMYCLTKDEIYRKKAEALEEKLDAVLAKIS